MKQIYFFAPANQSPRPLGLKTMLLCVAALIILLASATTHRPVLSAGRAAGQRGNCRTAVARLQRAVTAEASASAYARRTQCQFLSLEEDERGGRPQAINDLAQRKLLAAVKESAAAREAARDCDTSQVVRPKTGGINIEARNVMMACYYRKQISGQHVYDLGIVEILRGLGIVSPPDSACDKLAEQSVLDCADAMVTDETTTQAEQAEETDVSVPDDLNPECRDAYLNLKAAEQAYERADKRERELAKTFSGAGARGREVYNRARLDVSRTLVQKDEAQRKLEACQAEQNEGSGFSLSGNWKCEDGAGTFVLVQSGSSLTWEGTSSDGGKTWTHTFTGEIAGDEIKGSYKDHEPGIVRQSGNVTFKIISNDQFERTYSSVGGGGCSVVVRQ